MGSCCSHTCFECDAPAIQKFDGWWRCDTHVAERMMLKYERAKETAKIMKWNDSSEDSEDEIEYADTTTKDTIIVDKSRLKTQYYDNFEAVFNALFYGMSYDEHELSRAPALERDIRRLLYEERKDKSPGYLYVFQLDNDSSDYYKIGYTKDIDTRMKAWQNELSIYGNLQVLLVHRVKQARFAERALHLLFAPLRVGRYQIEEARKLYTEYFYIKQRPNTLPISPLDPINIPSNIRKHKREVEWFHITDKEALLVLCAQVVDAINTFI